LVSPLRHCRCLVHIQQSVDDPGLEHEHQHQPLDQPGPVTPVQTSPLAQKSSSNGGPVTGGVVGGLFVIGAAAIGILFVLRRRGGGNSGTAEGGQGGGNFAEPMNKPAGAMAAVPLMAPPVGFDPNDSRYSTASSAAGYYKQPDGRGLRSPSYAGSPPPTYGVPGAAPASPQDVQYAPPAGQQVYPPPQAYSPQPQHPLQQQQGPPPAVSPVHQHRQPLQQHPYAPPPPVAHELGGGSAYPVPTTTAEGAPIYEAAGGRM
jgi:hypothetical protein